MRRCSSRIATLLLAMLPFSILAQDQPSSTQTHAIHESQGMPPRATPADYGAQATVGSVTLAAEFMGHSVPRPEGPLATDDYVVVELGAFGPADAHPTLSRDNFSLVINGKKKIPSEPYVAVFSSIKDPAYVSPEEEKAKKEKEKDSKNEPPPIIHVPFELRRAMNLYLEKASLPEGDRPLPKAGLLFFPFRGKNIHSVELHYAGPLGNATIELHP
jgi:hypothetical protein